jgi:hypothetical protein
MSNNGRWVFNEFREWLERGLISMNQLAGTYESHDNFEETKLEKTRLESKRDTLNMVLQKLNELEYE